MYIILPYNNGGQVIIIKEQTNLIVSCSKQVLTVDTTTNNVLVRTSLYKIGICG